MNKDHIKFNFSTFKNVRQKDYRSDTIFAVKRCEKIMFFHFSNYLETKKRNKGFVFI